MARKILKANEGMVLTNGEIYGKTIYLSEYADETTFYEITEEEYANTLNKETNEIME